MFNAQFPILQFSMKIEHRELNISLMLILLVSSNRPLVRNLRAALIAAGHVVTATAEAAMLTAHEPAHDYDGIIIDAGADDAGTADWIRRWRAGGRRTPLIALTVHADAAARIALLVAGADDCLTVPLITGELLARLAAVTRRRAFAVPASHGYEAAGFLIDPDSRTVASNGETAVLTEKEFRIFEYLIRNPNRAVTRQMIGEHVWGMDFTPQSNTVDVYISYLRRKLAPLKAAPIVTVRDAGYAFRPPLSSMRPQAI